jgi:segregation and condensation protein B
MPSRHRDMSDTALQIEALLFATGRPLSRREVAKALSVEPGVVDAAVGELTEAVGRGVVVVDDGRELELRVVKSAADLVERVRKDEYSREVGRAGQETLSAVLYRGPLTRSEVDFIRGVNSSQTLRTLTMRGLLRKLPNPRDERSFLYEPTTELLASLGVSSVKELPDYTAVREKLNRLEASYKQREQSND